MNMEKIMAKFSTFNSRMSEKSNNSKDDDDEEDDETEIQRNDDEEDHEEKKDQHGDNEDNQPSLVKIESDFKEQEPLNTNFTDNEYWKSVNILSNTSVDDLLADYE